MLNGLIPYQSVAEAISLLLFPHAEVVLHDLKTGCIDAIFNNLSKRAIGDKSLLDEISHLSDSQNVFPPYFKSNWDGRKMKSVTAVLRDKASRPIGLLCINLDISKWEEMHHFIRDLIKPATEMPDYLFKNDWREKINIYVSIYLKKHALRLESLDKSEKSKLLLALQKEGAFDTKNAASYIAEVLQISRATVYNYLKEIMKIPAFKLEEFWKKYEFTAPYLLCCSDAESWKLHEILDLADSESKQLWESLSLGYTESPGLPLLRQEIARLYSNIDMDQILTFAGAEEGIYCLMRTLIEPGHHVIVIDPSYQSLVTLPKSFGANMTSIKLDPQKQWQLGLEQVKKVFRSDTKLLVLNYPHNPTGAVLEKKVLEGLIELARQRGAYIFCDEVYRYLEIDERNRLPSIADAYEKGVALNVMTKSFGLAGIRMGWLASQDVNFLQKVGSYKLYTSICNSAPSEILALMALRAKDKILKRNREIMLNNLKVLHSFMKRNEERLSWNPPQSGPMAILKLLFPVPIEEFAEELVENMGVLIMPGSVFDLAGNYFRVGFGKKNMIHALDRFEQFLMQYGK